MKSTYLSFQPILYGGKKNKNKMVCIKTVALYIHIPFCEKVCYYCSINTKQGVNKNFLDQYLFSLEKELQILQIRDRYEIKCVHIGGGTPSILDINQLKRLISILCDNITNFNVIEKVIEVNPHSMTFDKIDFLAAQKKITINYGIQTFDNSILNIINRDSDSVIMKKILQYTCNNSFMSVGIDLMIGLPRSNLDIILRDIETAKKLNIDHIALYPLRIEPRTEFYAKMEKYEDIIPTDDYLCKILDECNSKMKVLGYTKYSIFHYSSKKIMTHQYGRDQAYGLEWIGVGAGAKSYINNISYYNIENPNIYIQSVNNDKQIKTCIFKLNLVQQIVRELLYKIRIGIINKQEIVELYGLYGIQFLMCLRILLKENYLVETEEAFALTYLGIIYIGDMEESITKYFDNLKQKLIHINCNENLPMNYNAPIG